jgi:7-cyano-7-deazaguanine synthase
VFYYRAGLDSAVALAQAVKVYGVDAVTALSYDYGQRHKKELAAAQKIADFYKVGFNIINMQDVFKLSQSSLLNPSANVTQGTYVPFRNGLFISAAAVVAQSLGATEIWYGAHLGDAGQAAYPDCTMEFFTNMSGAVYSGTDNAVKLIAPFIDKTKKDIIKIGAQGGVPFGLTWSCYSGEKKPCGLCATCVERKKAFEDNELKDV